MLALTTATAEELSAEDQQLKDELDMLVERLTVSDGLPLSHQTLITSRNLIVHYTNQPWRQSKIRSRRQHPP